MLRDRLKVLFNSYEPLIQQIVSEVAEFEQMSISMERPRFKEPLDEIITNIAKQQLEKEGISTIGENDQ